MSNNYVTYHLHTDLSLSDSATSYKDMVDKACELGQTAIAFTEHGNIFSWISKKQYCDSKGIKYIHGCEVYLTERLKVYNPETGEYEKIRDNYHTILLAKNYAGVLELNSLISMSYDKDHFYYKPRLSFDEFLNISDNIIKTSACIVSPLNRLSPDYPRMKELIQGYDYLEIQPHNHLKQKEFNIQLAVYSQEYGIPLIAGTDTHSLNAYKAECRTILQYAKEIVFTDEDGFDLTYKSYDELVEMFKEQGVLPESMYLEAIENTNRMAASVEEFEIDTSFKYPYLYGELDGQKLKERVAQGLSEKIKSGAITQEQIPAFEQAITEELEVFEHIDMMGFMLFMSELATWCKSNGIIMGFGRGSCAGSRVAYLTDIIDVNPETWKTVFSRFASYSRKELGDIDCDFAPSDRDRVYEYITNRFDDGQTARVMTVSKLKPDGFVDLMVKAFRIRWNTEHLQDTKPYTAIRRILKDKRGVIRYISGDEAYVKDNCLYMPQNLTKEELLERTNKTLDVIKESNDIAKRDNPYTTAYAREIKKAFAADEATAREKYKEVFYYYDGMMDVITARGIHAAGIVASPITLRDHYGTFISDGKEILMLDMDEVHDTGLVKYDILGLQNMGIIKDVYDSIGKPYPKSHEINWNDDAVWDDLLTSPVGIFQFESSFAFDCLKRFKPRNLFDMCLVTACIRPSGSSYRDELLDHKPHKNPSPIIDELLSDNFGYLIYQEDVIKFLQQICGLSGSEADNIRRAIGRKQKDRLDAAMPDILNGYCEKSERPREIAEEEAKEFLQILEDSSSYMFGYNHSISYCMISYLCAYLRYYYPVEFITAYLNNATQDKDIVNGSELAMTYKIRVVPPTWGFSGDNYTYKDGMISKGISSIKGFTKKSANQLNKIANNLKTDSFMDALTEITTKTDLGSDQIESLIRVDYFKTFGNENTLMKIYDAFRFFKGGEVKKISKSKLTNTILPVVQKNATDVLKSGKISTTYTITNAQGLLHDTETLIKSMALPELTLKQKADAQSKVFGYVDLFTGKEEDRRKLYILDIFGLRSKKTGKIWAHSVKTKSIGSGKTAKLTLYNDNYAVTPIKQGDIIYAWNVSKDSGGYWCLKGYDLIED